MNLPNVNKVLNQKEDQKCLHCFFKCFFGVPHLATYILLFSYEPGLGGTGIDPGMTYYIISI